MIDHISLKCANYEKSKRLYEEFLRPLGYSIIYNFDPKAVGFGDPLAEIQAGHSPLWLTPEPEDATKQTFLPIHIAFMAKSREDVDRFYEAAIIAGARDNGPPGIRPMYHSNYYGAFVIDFDGNNVEAVCHYP